MRTVVRVLCGMCLIGLLFSGEFSSELQGKGKAKRRNPQTTVIIHFDDGQAEKPPWAGGPGGGEEDPPVGDGVSYSLIGGVWADDPGIDNGADIIDPNLTFVFDPSGFPAGTDAEIMMAFAAWEEVTAGRLLNTITQEVGVAVEFGDGVNTYTMRNLGGGGVLAATYITWDDDGNGVIDPGEEFLEMDVIHNYTVSWAIAEDNPKGRWWDIRNVATHEIGHVYGLGHSGNDETADYIQTMYASAPAKETEKRDLEDGDREGIRHDFLGYGTAIPAP